MAFFLVEKQKIDKTTTMYTWLGISQLKAYLRKNMGKNICPQP
jgi:hypothetical protein